MDDPVERPINHKLHIVLMMLTAGLWLIPYLILVLARTLMDVDRFLLLVARNQTLMHRQLEQKDTSDN